MRLEQWGISREQYEAAGNKPEYRPGRVIAQERDMYRVVTEEQEYMAGVSGKFRYNALRQSDYPAVGDYVLVECNSEDDYAVIREVLPRKNAFVRKAAGTNNEEQIVAANIDTVFICMSLNKDFNIRRIERYLSITWDSGASPVIVLTKKDLCDESDSRLAQISNIAIGVPVIAISVLDEEGLKQLYTYLGEKKTAAFVGSSGVGKSTLINRLLEKNMIKTGALRNDDKGRHTTTHRELFMLREGGMVIDTPGMRELGMWSSEDGIERTFSDIEELSGFCRFSDCTHSTEPGCAVRNALKEGVISEERYQAYKKLKAENAYNEDAAGYLSEKRMRFKEIAKYNKKHQRK